MTNPYEVWNTRRSLGVMRHVEPVTEYWGPLAFPQQINSTDEWIDFEKLPAQVQKLAPFVRPLGPGKPIYSDRSTGFRFRPAYVKVSDHIDPLMPLIKRAGIDRAMLDDVELTPERRRDLIRIQMTAAHVNAIQRRWEWMRARAIIDGKVQIVYQDETPVEIDFRRNADQTIIKDASAYWGMAGVSIFDDIQRWADRMFDAEFGGFPTRLTIGTKVWKVMRQDEEFMEHMDVNKRNPRATIERGLIDSGKVVKVGELMVGGQSGSAIEIYLYRDTFVDENGAQTPFMNANDVVMTASAQAIMGYNCFGMIVDPSARYQALDIYPKNFWTKGEVETEHLVHQSSPLMVPVNPNATLRATVVAE